MFLKLVAKRKARPTLSRSRGISQVSYDLPSKSGSGSTVSCGESSGRSHSIQFVNNCGFGNPSLRQTNGQTISGPSANFAGPVAGGIGFLDQGLSQLVAAQWDIIFGAGVFSSLKDVPRLGNVRRPAVFAHIPAPLIKRKVYNNRVTHGFWNVAPASVVVTFCPTPPSWFRSPSTTPPIASATSPISTAHASPSPAEGSLGGAAFLVLFIVAIVFIRRRRAREAEARMPQRQEPFVVNPTWVLPSPTTPEATHSHLSLPDRARPRTIPVVTQQMSMPNLATQYRARMLRPRASTVGSVLARTETRGSREQSDPDVGSSRSESGVPGAWRPRIDILGVRHQRAEGLGPGQPQTSFWAE
ncbi:hypothetical protein B0H13DRAFT_2331847 [Mycena leptocephala]|nr:hypothetical protein B0H13DRAFT_2331847 [Mycena leptocephala]